MPDELRYKIKDWKEFQHYHKPNPTWIKLYKKITYDRSIMTLDDFTFKLLICCWLFACKDKTNLGILPTSNDIAYNMHKSKEFIDKHLELLSREGLVSLYSGSRDCLAQRREEKRRGETETETEKKQSNSVSFDIFWKLYPSGKAKATAIKAFTKALKKTTIEIIMDAVKANIASNSQWSKDNGKFIPMASTWLNREQWDDELDCKTTATHIRVNKPILN